MFGDLGKFREGSLAMGLVGEYLEDGLPGCNVQWLGSPLFTSHEARPFIRGISPFRRRKRSPWAN